MAAAIEGESGTHEILDYRGVPVLSAFAPIDVNSTRWAVLAEIDAAEVAGEIQSMRAWIRGIAVVAGIACALAVAYSVYQIFAPDEAI